LSVTVPPSSALDLRRVVADVALRLRISRGYGRRKRHAASKRVVSPPNTADASVPIER
jgi:hypothetical protein